MVEHPLDDETRYHLLRLLEQDPALSQRRLARELGVSVGKINYCLRALLEKGLVKAANFRSSDNKHAYLYQLTPHGLAEKSRVTRAFLVRKVAEYKEIEREIAVLRRELAIDDRR